MMCVDPRKLDEIPEKIVDMMGYKTGYPFLGSGTSPLLDLLSTCYCFCFPFRVLYLTFLSV